MFGVFKKVIILLMPLLVCVLCFAFINTGGNLTGYRFDFATYFKNFSNLDFPLRNFLSDLRNALADSLQDADFNTFASQFNGLWNFGQIDDISTFFQNIGIFFKSLGLSMAFVIYVFFNWFLFFFKCIYYFFVFIGHLIDFIVKLFGVLVDVPLIALN